MSRIRRYIPAVIVLALLLAAAVGPARPPDEDTDTLAAYPAAPPGARFVEEGWFAPPQPTAEKPVLPLSVEQAFVIPIHGPITDTTYEAVRRKVIYCRGVGAKVVVFDMNTPGGSGEAMRKIVRLIVDDLADIYAVAFVDPEAFSAGAIISLACNEIVMVPTGVIGDAMPIMIGPGGQLAPIPDKERGKFESAMRTEVRVLAKRNGYSVPLCEAMITITMEIWLVRDTDTGELRIVEADAWRNKVSGAPDQTGPARQPTSTAWEYVRTIDGPNELVTMTADEALEYGLAGRIFENMDDIRGYYGLTGPPTRLTDTWSEKLVAFLTTPAVTSILLMAALFFAYVEMHTAGFGAAGAMAVACFALLVGGRYLIGLANWWEIALLSIGVVLLMLEIFLIPGFGIFGITGLLCIIVGLVAMVLPNAPDKLPIPQTEMDWDLLTKGIFAIGVGFVAALIAAALVSKYLARVPIASKLIMAQAEAASSAPASEVSPIHRIDVGAEGTVHSPCRPVGMVRFGDELFDAVAEGEMIESGASVRVLRREGNRLVIERVT